MKQGILQAIILIFITIAFSMVVSRGPQFATIHVSYNGSDVAGQGDGSIAKPYATIAKAYSVAANGDVISLERGGHYYDQTAISKNITINAYGTGAKPIWSAAKPILSNVLVSEGNDRYSRADASHPAVINMVYVDGKPLRKARWPDSGYMTITSKSGNHIEGYVVVTGAGALGNVWIGAELVVKVAEYQMKRLTISNQVGDTLYYRIGRKQAPVESFAILTGWGCFIQDDLDALNRTDEYVYDSTAKKLTFHQPGGMTGQLKVAYNDYCTTIWTAVNVENIHFEGSNMHLVNFFGTPAGTVFTDCDFTAAGTDACYGLDKRFVTFVRPKIKWCQNNGIRGAKSSASSMGARAWSVTGGLFEEIALEPGMVNSGGSQGTACNLGDSSYVGYSVFNEIGYNPIGYGDNACLIEYNTITNYLRIMADGAGIYNRAPGNNDGSVEHDEHIDFTVRYNFIWNGIGNHEGVGETDQIRYVGIYMDDKANAGRIYGNVVGNTGRGFFCHNCYDADVYDNTFYNCKMAWRVTTNDAGDPPVNVDIYNNRVVMSASTMISAVQYQKVTSGYHNTGLQNNNKFFLPSSAASVFRTDVAGVSTNRTFSNWKTYTSWEAAGTVSDDPGYQIYYNWSANPIVQPLAGTWTNELGAPHTGSITIQPYTAVLLYQTAPPVIVPGEGKRVLLNDKRVILNGKHVTN